MIQCPLVGQGHNKYYDRMDRKYKRDWLRKKNGTTDDSLKVSATWKGYRAEILALELLPGAEHMNREIMNQPFDILWRGICVDVKSCELYQRKNKRGKKVVSEQSGCWVFNKNKGSADKYLCICMLRGVPFVAYLIPAKEFGNGTTIGWKSKFSKYTIKKWN